MSKLHRFWATIILAVMGSAMAWAVDYTYVYFDSDTKTYSMSCGTAGATIYYTVDGTDPTTSTNRYKYTEPFQANRTLTISAAAEKDGEWSPVNNFGRRTVDSRFLNNNIYYQLVTNTLDDVIEVSPRQTGTYEGDIVIPPTVDFAGKHYTVIRIGDEAFNNADNITSISLPNTITSIGYNAFYNCDKLYDITLPSSVKTIEASAFYYCHNLKNVSLNEGLETIGNQAFYYCNNLSAITLPSTLKTIGNEAFQYCFQFKTIRIPDSVTSIGHSLFESCSSLASVQLPATLAAIPEDMFGGCGALRSIQIPSTVKSIGNSAFSNCDALTSVTIPEGVETLGHYVFYDCDNLLSVSIPEGITSIPNETFRNNYSLTTVSLPSTIQTIGMRAFNNCESLPTITIPENVAYIDKFAFTECDKLTSVYCLPTTPPEMSGDNDGNAFLDALQRATLYVKAAALNNYTSSPRWDEFQTKQTIDNVFCEQPTFALTDYVLTMSTATAGATIYYTTDGTDPTTASTEYTGPIPFLKNGTIRAIAVKEGMDNSAVSEFVKSNYQVPSPVATIDENFMVTIDCETPNITGFPETQVYYKLLDDSYSWNYKTIAEGGTGWEIYDSPIQLTRPKYIATYAVREGWIDSKMNDANGLYDFYNPYYTSAPSIEWVSAKNKIRLYNYAADATAYYTLDGTEPTAESAVYNPDDSIAINRNVIIRCIAVRPGYFASEIASQTITGVAQTFYEGGFYYRLRDNMTADEVEVTRGENHKYQGDIVIERYVEHNGTKFAVTRIGNNAFYDNKNLTSITLHDGINSIGEYAFYDCDGLTSMNIPGSVKEIGNEAFNGCDNITILTLAEGLETIGNRTFYHCSRLPNVTLPSTLTTIGDETFTYCYALRSLTIPNSVTSIGHSLCYGDYSLSEVKLSNQLTLIPRYAFYGTALRSIDIPSSVKTIGDYAFCNCDALVSVSIPVGVETLGEYMFYTCNNLLSVTIPEGVKQIPNYAFRECYALTTVSLPTSLQTIGYNAFQDCRSMETITIPENVETIGTEAFTRCDNLSNIYCLGLTPPTLNGDDGYQAFVNVVTHATLHVKKAAEGNYKVARHWNKFNSFELFDNIMAAQPTFKFENYRLSISTATDGASIYYTTDGTEPSTASTKYTAPINFWKNGTVKAISVKEGMDNSLIGEFKKEDMKVATPVVTMDADFKVTMTCEQPDIEGFPEVRIKYVVNNDTYNIGANDESWQLYDGTPIQLTRPSYVHYYAERDGWISTDQAYENYSSDYYVYTPSIQWNSSTQKAYIYSYESYFPADATVYYTLDGSDPTRESLVYNPSDSIPIARNLIVKAFAVRDGHFDSEIGSRQIWGVTQTFSKEGIYYRLVDNVLANEVEVTKGNRSYEGDIVIPDKISYAGVEYTVTRIGNEAFSDAESASIQLPATIQSIGQQAFYSADNLTEIDIPSSVKYIESRAFYRTGLEKITLHDGLESIDDHAFYDNNYLTDFTLPQTLKSIGEQAFYSCNLLTTMVIPESVTTIGKNAFEDCFNLVSVTLPSGWTELPEGIFQGTALKSVVIPTGVTKIGYRAFYGCWALNSVTIPASVQTIKNEAFMNCRSLTSVSIPEGVTAIENSTFQGCNLLTTVQLPSTLTTIGESAFRDCAVMPNVTLPENLKTIGTYAFNGCTALTSVYSLAATPPTLNGDGNTNAFATVMENATLYTKSGDKEKYENANHWSSFKELTAFENVPCAQPTFTLENFRLTMKSNTAGATIYYTTDDSEPTTQSLKYTAPIPLLQNDTIRAIAVAEGYSPSVISDFRKADYKMDVPTASLSDDLVMTITYGGATEELAPVRLYYKENTSDSYWDSKPWILYEGPVQLTKPRYYRVMAARDGWLDSNESSTYNYYSNYRLDSPQMSWSKDETTGIGTMTLSYYNNNSEGDFYYTLDGTEPTKENGMLYTEPIQILRNLTVKAVAWKEKHFYSEVKSQEVTNVSRTFYVDNVWYRLTDNSLANEVEVTNGNIAYEGDVNIPATVTIQGTTYDVVGIGYSAFNNQDKVTSITLPASITYIGENAFYDADKLQTIDIPEKVKSIGKNAFFNCDILATVTLHEGLESIGVTAFYSMPALKTIVIPSTVTTIGNGAFYNCTSLTSAVLPAGLKAIPETIFRDNKQLADITLPTALETIGQYAFAGTAITTMQLPATVTQLGEGVFNGCKQLTNMVIPEGVTELGKALFAYCSVLTSVTLPTTLQRVGKESFYNCPSLESIVLPASLKTIGSGAFNDSPKLMSVYSQATTPATIEGDPNSYYSTDRDAFNTIKQQATLFVPETAVEAYKNKQFWQEFGDHIVGSNLVPCEQPTFTFDDYKLTIKTLTPGATIYYSDDGSDPTTGSLRYTDVIPFTKNGIIRAIAAKEGMAPSPIAEYKRDDMKVAAPTSTLDTETFLLTISCETPETRIYYGIDQSYYEYGGEWKLYDGEPVQMTQPGYVHLYAERDGWISSDQRYDNYHTSYRIEKPAISVNTEERTVVITCGTEGANIYYTLDGTEPSKANGKLYESPFLIDRNLNIQAIGVMDAHFNSEIATAETSGIVTKMMAGRLYFKLRDYVTADEVELIPSETGKYEGEYDIPETITYGGKTYTVTSIADDAFYECSGVTAVTIPNTVNKLGYRAFGASGLRGISIPSSIKELTSEVFWCCNSLQEAHLPEGLEEIGVHCFQETALVSITLPSTLKKIGQGAFVHSTLTSIEIPNSVTYMGDEVFRLCLSLSQVKLSTSLSSIPRMAFEGTAIESIEIPEGITEIGNNAFAGCNKLASISLPEGLTTIGSWAFGGCVMTSIEIPSTVREIGERAFSDCTKLASISLPEGITVLSAEMFLQSHVSTVQLPTTLREIEHWAFASCSNLESLVLPANVTTLGENLFGGSNLKELYVLSTTPPETPDGNPFKSEILSTATLHVLATPGVAESYKSKPYWGEFNKIVTFEHVPCAQPTFVYENYKLEMSSQTEGVSIYYTTDGTAPTIASRLYTEPITLLKNDTILAMAVGDEWGQSLISEFRKNDFVVEQPTASINEDFVVTLKCNIPDVEGLPKTRIYYSHNRSTDDGGDEWTLYEGPFQMYTAGYIHVKAQRDGWIESAQSHINYFTDYYLAMPTISADEEKGIITLHHDNPDAQLFYTLDGSDPNFNGVLYTEPIKPEHNVNVVVIAKKEGAINSDPEQREFRWFTIPNPQISIEHLAAVMSVTEPATATIHYTLDGSDPTEESPVYEGPVMLTADSYIRAFAVAKDWNNSAQSWKEFVKRDYTVVTPTFGSRQIVDGIMVENADSVLTITTATAGATIYYTLDGSTPTANSLVYENGIKLTENCTVKAYAVKEDLFDSEAIEAEVEWFTVKQPHIVFSGKYVEMSDDTEDAVIYYTIDGTTPDTKSKVYQKPFALDADQIVVRAIGVKEDWNNSEVSSLTYNPGKNYCETPGITRVAGTNKVQMTTRTQGAKIYFTNDGLNPTINSTLYTAEVEVTENCTLKAMAADSLLYDSDVTTFAVDWFKVDQPVIAADGIFLTITAPKEGSKIYYTLDGSEPTTGSTLYEGTLTMKGSCTIKAMATYENFNNSSVAVFNYYSSEYTCGLPSFSREGNKVSIASAPAEGTTIYYTTDGTTPTTASSVFTEPIEVEQNITIKALATNDKLFTSDVADYEVNWFKVETPVIAFDGIFATITCSTPNSRIYYTLDGSSPTAESLYYTDAITMTASCTVKAIAMRDNFNNSAVMSVSFDKASNTISTPQFVRNGNEVTVKVTQTEGTTIYYTLDGTTPTTESTVYTTPVQVVENGTLKAMATNPKLFTSEVATYDVDWFKVTTPVLTLNGNTLTMSCTTPDAVIYYEYDEAPTTKSAVYSGPITLVDNRMVYAMAVKNNFHDSEVATVAPDLFVCTQPTFAYNGRYLEVQTGENMDVHYTLDGSKPTEDSEVYDGQIEIKELCTVRAIAMRRDFRDSPEASYTVSYVYTGEDASQTEAGHLADMFQWVGGADNVENLPISGKINDADLAFIRSLKSLRHLDLTDAVYEGSKLPDEAFANMPLLTFQSPKQLNSVGDHLFRGCDQLAAIVWNANIAIPETVTEDVKGNANFLLYVNSRIHVPSSYTGNIISGGQATSITLSDAGSGNFCCPQRFFTNRISYTHTYSQTTESGVTCGWETLALPFDVQSITHERRGAMAPFSAQEDYSLYKPFWLYELQETGFSDATEVKAYTPYIISMPNNPNYADDFILAGKVTFSAADTYIEVDTAMVTMKGSVRFAPAMQRQEKSSTVLAINLEDCTVDGTFYRSGSAFLPNLRTVNPFEAYALVGASVPKIPLVDMEWGYVTDMRNAQMSELEAIGRKGGVYDLLGRKLSNDSSNLKNDGGKMKRVYIINGKKVVVE